MIFCLAYAAAAADETYKRSFNSRTVSVAYLDYDPSDYRPGSRRSLAGTSALNTCTKPSSDAEICRDRPNVYFPLLPRLNMFDAVPTV